LKKETKRRVCFAVCMFVAFGLWTAAVCLVDVQPIGPQGTAVGFATVNGFAHGVTGVHMALYTITDWLGLVPLGVAACFAMLGLRQWIGRKRIGRVDHSILVLGGFYLAVAAAYIFFELVVVNYRPVLIGGCPEASYPSSTTVLVLCVMPTAMMQFGARIRSHALRRWAAVCVTVFTVFMVMGRLVSGVHWLSDIIGGALLSAGLVTLYRAVSGLGTK